MEYNLFIGSQSEINTPGNEGQLTITDFSMSGDGKVTVRFAPARQPDQTEDIS